MISSEVHRNYFYELITVCSEILYLLYVVAPTSVDEVETHMHEYQLAGFAGAIESTDATHIALEKCSYHLKDNHLGAKQHLTTRSFNLTVNHHRRILSTTVGYPGRWNNKTIVLFDPFVKEIYEGLCHYRNLFFIIYPLVFLTLKTFFTLLMLLHHTVNLGDVLPTVSFQLYEYDANGYITMAQYEGPWLIVDNGYLKGSMTVLPIKIHANEA
jgi:hypothetical protein